MRIESAQVSLASQHSQVTHQSVQESLRVSVSTTRLSLSAQARDALVGSRAAERATGSGSEGGDVDPRLAPLIRLIEEITGRPVRRFSAERLQEGAAQASRARAASAASGQAQVRAGLSYERRELRYEAESTQVQAQGVVRTADGREICFELSVSLQREHLQTSSVSLQVGDAAQLKDPLVLNFDGPAAELSDLRFSFDIDADGSAESLHFAGPGSGFLVLDHNANGRIDDGSEMFGALSGDGFADLAALDSDGNGWIDENDPAFARLQVWRKGAQGQDRLDSLADAGVGALYLGRAVSPFAVKDAGNQTLAQVRSTGLYLSEDGQARAMQQIDLAV